MFFFKIKKSKKIGERDTAPLTLGSRRVPSRENIPHACLDLTAYIRRSTPSYF